MGSTANRKKSASKPQPGLGLHQLPGELLVDDDVTGGRWFECAPEWPEPAEGGLRVPKAQWREVAGEALASMSRIYDKRVAQRGKKDIQRVLNREKTVGDKIAAATLVVQESPLHRLDEMNTLFSFVKKKGRRERSPAIDAFKDLLINDLLPDDRRLLNFDDREFECGPQALSKRHLSYALFEEELKSLYSEFLDVLDECGKDSISHFKLKSVSVVFDLLVAKPENEKQLLGMLVNKLGDPERKVASNASYYLRLLVEKHHPQMKLILVQEVEQLLHRKNIGRKTQYYAVSFLNQLRFSKDDVDLARRLVALYMDVVTLCLNDDKDRNKLKKEGGVESKESRIMGALLTGVNRAFPYTKPEAYDPSLDSQYDSLFRVAHAKSISSATQALAFLLQISKCNSTLSDRFYRALYSRIGDLASAGESKQALLLNLIYKAMKEDVSARRVRAFTKRLLQTALRSPSGLAGGTLVLLSEVLTSKHPGMLKAATTVAEGDDGDEVFKDVESESELQAGKCSGETQTILIAGDEASNDAKQVNPAVEQETYNIAAREPLHARAERSALWELTALAAHNHPSVNMFARTLCADQRHITYSSDPLTDFTLMAFLDKFSYKKPKRKLSDSLHGKRAVRASESLLQSSNLFFESVRKGDEADEDAFFGKFFQINPIKLDSIEGKNGEDEIGEHTVQAPDSESEEEAFEKAMHEEMRRLGGGMPVTDRGDIDEEDPDELTAFVEAFKDEIESDVENVDGKEQEENDALALQEITAMDYASDPELTGTRKKDSKRKADSVFAFVEDYAEKIEDSDAKLRAVDTSANSHDGMRRKTSKNPKAGLAEGGSAAALPVGDMNGLTSESGPQKSKNQRKRKRKRA